MSFRADRGRDSPSATLAVAFSQAKGVPPVRWSWPSTFSLVRGTFRASSGTGPSTWATLPSLSSAATRAGSPGWMRANIRTGSFRFSPFS